MGKRWRQWSSAEAGTVLREWRRSGKSASTFARERGISVRRLSYWAKQLSPAGESTVQFVPVSLAEATTSSAAVIEIEHAGVTVRVREDVDVELVGQLFAAVVRAVRPC